MNNSFQGTIELVAPLSTTTGKEAGIRERQSTGIEETRTARAEPKQRVKSIK